MNKKVKNFLQMAGLSIAGLCLSALMVWGAIWVGKTVTYKLFYEDMVRQTVAEMVDAEYLKKVK